MEAGSTTKRLTWGVIAVLACAFCYSIGFQSGWSEATVKADVRLLHMSGAMEDMTVRIREGNDAAGDEARVGGDAVTVAS